MDETTISPAEFEQFRGLIHQLTGIALNDGKRQLAQSRLQKRLRLHGMSRFRDYYDFLTQSAPPDEVTAFINCITTNKTDFYREPHHFEFIERTVLPPMIAAAQAGAIPPRLRVWHAGCSTGEEPYTLAITLREVFERHPGWDVRQLASDIDTDVLAHAAHGVYRADRVAPVPPDLLRKYFLRGRGDRANEFQAKPILKEQIAFRQINLLDDDWPIRSDVRFDMIFCRNVVIYFDKPTQQKLFAKFQKRLRPGGYLFIGHSESLIGVSDAFAAVGQTVYQLPEARAREAAA